MERYFKIWVILVLLAFNFACKTTKVATNTQAQDPSIKKNVDIIYVTASSLMMRGENEDAERAFRQVLKLDPKNHAAMYNIARLAYGRKAYQDAIEFGKAAVDLDSENYWYYLGLKEAYERKGDFGSALKIQEEISVRFNKTRPEESLKLVDFYIKQGENEKALETIVSLENKGHKSEELVLKKLRIFVQAGEQEKTVAATRELIQLKPSALQYYEFEYEALIQLKREGEAIAVLEKLLKQDANSGFALLNLADYYKDHGQLEKSDGFLYRAFGVESISLADKVRIYNEFVIFSRDNPEVLPRLDKLSQKMLEAHPKHALAFAARGDWFLLNKDYAKASGFYEKALAKRESLEAAWSGLLKCLSKQKKYDKLYSKSEEALEFYPNKTNYLYYYGIAGQEKKELDTAVYAFEKFYRLGANTLSLEADVASRLETIFEELGEAEKAASWKSKSKELKQKLQKN